MMPPVKEPLAGLALLVIFGLLIWYNRPIENPRLLDPYPQYQAPRPIGQGDAYEAWLWKDPFGFDSTLDQKSWGQTCQVSLKKILKKESVILAPLVKIRPDTVENKEIRTRHRYAVVAGLIEAGYEPREPDRLNFCSIKKDRLEYDIRWEHYMYNPKGNKPDIVVAWIDSEILTAENNFPADHKCTGSCNFAFKDLLKEISQSNKFYLFDLNNILVHDRSIEIKKHIKCINDENSANPVGRDGKKRQIKCGNDGNIKFLKPARIGGEAGSEEFPKKPTGELAQCNYKNDNKKTGSKNLAENLATELKLRGIKPSEVIIMTEQGSENAIGLQKSLCISLAEHECGNDSGTTSEIRTFFYLKGADGNPRKTGNQNKKDKNETPPSDKVEPVPVIDLHHPPPLPIGPSQLDYFHRLAGEIKNVHNNVDLGKRNSGAKAVVIFGSDFNDKLLLMEVLRAKMPHILILTTDLDAQMLYPQHWRSTRNLVVASHFNLLLRKKTDQDKDGEVPPQEHSYQEQFPPFRDSQQTNIFYRTVNIAKNEKDIKESQNTFPRIFEVGRDGFVHLETAEENKNPNYHPLDNTLENTKYRLGLLLMIAASLIWFYYAIRPRSGILSSYLLLGPLVVVVVVFRSGMDGLGEPLSFTDGVSLWPTIFIQITAVLFAAAFFVRAVCELDKNFGVLTRQYFPHLTICPNNNGPDECGPWLINRLRSLGPWLKGAHSLRKWGTFFVLILTVAVYAWNDVEPSNDDGPLGFDLSFWPCLGILAVVAMPYIWRIGAWKRVSIKHWIEKDGRRASIDASFRRGPTNPPDQKSYESALWWKYYYYGWLGHRIARVVAIWLIFAIIETLLVYLLPPWPLPWRGESNSASLVGVLSFIVTMLLLFFVLDAVRLNFYWIKKLRKQHPLLSEQAPSAYNLIGNDSLKSLEKMVAIVAERTQAVDKLIYYPMLCIMLMLFSKITYFDNQDFPLSKGITFGAAISLLFFSGFMLRYEAEQFKLSVIKSVRNNGTTKEIITETIKRIDDINDGAFQPMLEQPVMQALLIILASIGLFAGEYLKLLG